MIKPKGSLKLLVDMSIKSLPQQIQTSITMDFIDTVLEGDDRSYFTCRHEEHLLLPAIYTYIHLSVSQQLLNNVQSLKKSFNTEGQWQNTTFKPTDISTIV